MKVVTNEENIRFYRSRCGIFPSLYPPKLRILPLKEGCMMTERKKKRPTELVDAIIAEQRRKDRTDVLGSYTGVPWDEWDDPVQDVDDL